MLITIPVAIMFFAFFTLVRLVAIPVAFVFAGLRTGSSFVGATGVEGRITDVIQGFLVLALLVPPAVMFLRDRGRARAAATEGARADALASVEYCRASQCSNTQVARHRGSQAK